MRVTPFTVMRTHMVASPFATLMTGTRRRRWTAVPTSRRVGLEKSGGDAGVAT